MTGPDEGRREALPVAVRELALRLGADPASDRATIRLTQRGRIRRRLETDTWMAFAGVIPITPSAGDARAYALTVALLVVAAAVAFWAEGRRARIPVGAGPPAMEGASHDRS